MRIGYIRVSTDSGEQEEALANQRLRVEAAGVDALIEDRQSGRDADRPGYQELLSLIDRRQVKTIVITRLDRLSRDAAECDSTIAFAAKRGVVIEALDGGELENVSPQGFLLTRMATTMAEFESRMLSMRIKRGYEQSRKRLRPCRARAPWGYRQSFDRSTLEPDPLEWPRAQKFLRYLRRYHWRLRTAWVKFLEAEGEFPLHSPKAIRCWVQNPILRGGLGYKKINDRDFQEVTWGILPVLIDPKEWPLIERRLDRNRRLWGINTKSHEKLLTGLCFCVHCKKRMTYKSGRKIPALQCQTHGCINCYKSIHEETVYTHINETLRQRVHLLTFVTNEELPEVSALRIEIKNLELLDDADYAPVIEAKRNRLISLLATPCRFDPDLLKALEDPAFWTHWSRHEMRQVYLQTVQKVWIEARQVAQVDLLL